MARDRSLIPSRTVRGEGRALAIVPAFNEAGCIGAVVRSLRSEHVGVPLDVLVVNDGSSDETSRLAREAGALVVDLPFNVGIGATVQTGFRWAAKNRYRVAFQCDADGQHRACQIRTIIDPILRGEADVVIGSRFLRTTGYRSPPLRRIGIWIFYWVTRFLTGNRITDNTSGFRAYGPRAYRFLAQNYPYDYPEPEAVVLLSVNGFSVREVAVEMQHRLAGLSSIDVPRSIYYMMKVPLASLVTALRPRAGTLDLLDLSGVPSGAPAD